MKFTDPDGEIIFTILSAIFFPPALPFAIAADIGGIINTASHWNNIKSTGNFWSSFGKGTLFYLAGGANGALTATANPLGFFAGGAIEELSNGLISGNTKNLGVRTIVSGGAHLLGGKITKEVISLAGKGLNSIGVTNKLTNKVLSNIAGSVPGTFTTTTLKYKFGNDESWSKSFRYGIKSIPGAVLSGIGAGVSSYIGDIQNAKRVNIKADPFDYYNDNFNWKINNSNFNSLSIPKTNISIFITPKKTDWWRLFSPYWFQYPWEKH